MKIARVFIILLMGVSLHAMTRRSAADQTLHSGVADNNFDQINQALDAGADVNARNEKGQAPLMIATWANNVPVVDLLLNRGANPNLTDEKNQTPLMIATWNGSYGLVDLLSRRGTTNLDIRDKNGQTALLVATWNGNNDIVELLLRRGADRTVRNSQGKTALDVAREHPGDRSRIVQVLETVVAEAVPSEAERKRQEAEEARLRAEEATRRYEESKRTAERIREEASRKERMRTEEVARRQRELEEERMRREAAEQRRQAEESTRRSGEEAQRRRRGQAEQMPDVKNEVIRGLRESAARLQQFVAQRQDLHLINMIQMALNLRSLAGYTERGRYNYPEIVYEKIMARADGMERFDVGELDAEERNVYLQEARYLRELANRIVQTNPGFQARPQEEVRRQQEEAARRRDAQERMRRETEQRRQQEEAARRRDAEERMRRETDANRKAFLESLKTGNAPESDDGIRLFKNSLERISADELLKAYDASRPMKFNYRKLIALWHPDKQSNKVLANLVSQKLNAAAEEKGVD